MLMTEQEVPRRPFRALRWRLLRAQRDLHQVTGEEPSPVSGTQEAAEGGLTGKEESCRVLLWESISHRKHIAGRERERCREAEDPMGPGDSFSNMAARARERREVASETAH